MSQKTPTDNFPPYVTKYEIAEALQISISTLQQLMNRKYFNELKVFDYKPTDKKVSRKILLFLQEKLALIPEDFQ